MTHSSVTRFDYSKERVRLPYKFFPHHILVPVKLVSEQPTIFEMLRHRNADVSRHLVTEDKVSISQYCRTQYTKLLTDTTVLKRWRRILLLLASEPSQF